ncbi:hypothetical protein BOW53_03155 [Solemya pervernicosa gill symbiont]|uniref:Uncharacterized protein n=1 Tax=Solemya pervernicosa gill symbiont TaxID=642797 RepID=A0A1T2L991_9GAMM|nr:hypothetical protein [Solemya pervernicosa gill symbiont]OOZ41688.1 hypothetical protein BOW53_03155 [Solemya pervernicosa gill symbiont]
MNRTLDNVPESLRKRGITKITSNLNENQKLVIQKGLIFTFFKPGSRYFCESLFWASKPKQTAKTSRDRLCLRRPEYTDGVDYRGLTAFASLSMAVSE